MATYKNVSILPKPFACPDIYDNKVGGTISDIESEKMGGVYLSAGSLSPLQSQIIHMVTYIFIKVWRS